MLPETRYARSGDVSIAYQTLCDGPLDLVFVPGFVSHVEHWWEEPSSARSLRRLASFSRLILFDKRGTSLSDPVAGVPTLEERMDDVRAVMDAFGLSEHYRQIFELTRLDEAITIHDSEEAVLAAAGP